MVKDDKRGHRSWWWVLAGFAGLAFIMMAIMVWSPSPGAYATVEETQTVVAGFTATFTPTNTATPTATPTVNPECDLKVTKTGSPDPVDTDGQITYSITVENNADESGACDGFEVTDTIPDNTECVSIDVISEPSGVDVDFDQDDCDDADEGDEVPWDSTDDLDDGDKVVLKLVVELTSGADDGDTIENEACATSTDDELGDCDTERTDVEEGAATATPVATATTVAVPTVRPVVPPVVAPPPPAPSAGQAPTLVAPLTGTGTAAGGPLPLALALGLAGGCLLLLGGVAMLRRPR